MSSADSGGNNKTQETVMIYIDEQYEGSGTVTIKAEGLLIGESVDVLSNILMQHLEENRNVTVNIEKLRYISRSGKKALQAFESRIDVIHREENPNP